MNEKITIKELNSFLEYYEKEKWYESDDYVTFKEIKEFIS